MEAREYERKSLIRRIVCIELEEAKENLDEMYEKDETAWNDGHLAEDVRESFLDLLPAFYDELNKQMRRNGFEETGENAI